MVKGSRVTVKQAATALGKDDDSISPTRLIVRNRGSESVDLGDATVVSGAGFELKSGDREEIPLAKGETIFGIAATGKEIRVDVLELGD